MIDPDVFSFAALWRCYRRCRRNKRNTANALAFELDAEAKLLALQDDLRARSYRPGRSICFVTDGPKPREVFAADFRDRVVHHLLVGHQERVFEPMFIHDSFACRIGKGTLAASDRLMRFLAQATANGRRAAWALKLDVASFFPSIDKPTLYEIIARRMADPALLWLTRTLLFHDPTADYEFRSRDPRAPGPGSPAYPIPPHKSLFGRREPRGLPIGNLTSQFWGNVYLNELDQFVKRELKCRHYLRYVDDMVLLAEDAQTLDRWCEQVQSFLRDRLELRLRPGTTSPFPVRQGVEFVGWKTWWDHRLPRLRTLGAVSAKLERFERRAVRPALGGLAGRLDLGQLHGRDAIRRLHSMLASYAGHLRHGAAMRAWDALWARHPWLTALGQRRGWTIAARWATRGASPARGFHARYWRLARGAGTDVLLFFRVGRFIEFYGPQRLLAARVLGLRTGRIARGGFALAAGFPARLCHRYLVRAMRRNVAVAMAPRSAATQDRPTLSGHPTRVFVPSREAAFSTAGS